jgi:hypothetical protein
LKRGTWSIFLPVKAFSEHLEKRFLHGHRNNFQKLSNGFRPKYHQDSMILTPTPVTFFNPPPPFKADMNDVVDEIQTEVAELQTNDSFKYAFEPSGLRTFYCGLPSEIFQKSGNSPQQA